MDTFTFLVALIMILLAASFQEPWIVIGIVALMIIQQKNLKDTIALLIAVGIIFLIQSIDYSDLWPIILVGLIALAILLGIKPTNQGADIYGGGNDDGGLGGLMGGGY